MINPSEARADDEDFQNPVDLMFERLEEKDPEHFAVKQYKKYKLAAGVVCSKRLLNVAVRSKCSDILAVAPFVIKYLPDLFGSLIAVIIVHHICNGNDDI